MLENFTEFLFDENYALGLGCANCRDINICGGLQTPGLFSCWDLCCNDPATCDYICPRNLEDFVNFKNQIGGFEFDNVLRAPVIDYPNIPEYVPLIWSNSANRREKVQSDSVAIQLEMLVDLETGIAKFASRQSLSDHFGFPNDVALIITGVMLDEPLERYWNISRHQFIKSVADLEPAMVTSPNFSSFVNCTRWDNLANLKRIAICWQEFAAEGVPVALHMNARTLHDWKRWLDFIRNRPEIKAISFEFATVTADRKRWYVERLIDLTNELDRDLALVIRGGTSYVSLLAEVYDRLTLICTDAFMKATQRQMVCVDNESFAVGPESGYFIDLLLNGNIAAKKTIMRDRVQSGRRNYGK
ncbi:MAG: DUF4417 domain-containing protein [Pyrinomonadaceae bacterium]